MINTLWKNWYMPLSLPSSIISLDWWLSGWIYQSLHRRLQRKKMLALWENGKTRNEMILTHSTPQLQIFVEDSQSQSERYEIQDEFSEIVRMKVSSRHKSQTSYKLLIALDTSASSLDRLALFCCKCLSGLGTINPCGHIVAVLYLLGSGPKCEIPTGKLLRVLNEHGLHDESETKWMNEVWWTSYGGKHFHQEYWMKTFVSTFLNYLV